jgi:hypothetical protein
MALLIEFTRGGAPIMVNFDLVTYFAPLGQGTAFRFMGDQTIDIDQTYDEVVGTLPPEGV